MTRISFEVSRLDLCSFVGLDLRNFCFRECSLKEADFADASLGNADFRHSDLAGARFSLPEATLLLYGLGIEIEE